MMTRDELIDRLKHPLMNTSQHAMDQNVVILSNDASQRALIEQQAKEIERLNSKVKEWIRRKNHIERAYRGYGTPDEEIAKKAAWMKGQT